MVSYFSLKISGVYLCFLFYIPFSEINFLDCQMGVKQSVSWMYMIRYLLAKQDSTAIGTAKTASCILTFVYLCVQVLLWFEFTGAGLHFQTRADLCIV